MTSASSFSMKGIEPLISLKPVKSFGDGEGGLVAVHRLEGLLDGVVGAVKDGVEPLIANDVARDKGFNVGYQQST